MSGEQTEFPIASDLNTIAGKIGDHLADFLDIPRERVIERCRDDYDIPYHPLGDYYLVLEFGEEKFDTKGILQGAGRNAILSSGTFGILLWSRVLVDESDRDSVWLKDAVRGHLAIRRKFIDALTLFFPEDDDGNFLVFEPLHPVRASAPRRPSAYKGWGTSRTEFNLEYVVSVDTSIQ